MSDQGPRGTDSLASTILAPAAKGAAASASDSADRLAPELPGGQQLGAFRIVAKLGEGGMGVVYLAEDERLRRRVALKVLARTEDDELRRRFLREARAAAAVTHPNIAAIHEVGEAEGVSFIAMELVRGRTLRAVLIEKIDRREPFLLPEILRIGGEVARGLTAAHRAGIVHRDLKPENVMISNDDRVILLDFGIAKRFGVEDPSAVPRGGDLAAPADLATAAGSILGTPGYMSPEQFSGSRVDSRTDVFALGVMLYELLTGERPFGGTSLFAVLLATQRTIVAPPSQQRPDTPPELDRIVLRCLEKSPEARYRDGAELLDDLDRLARPPPSAAVPLPLPRDSLLRRGLAFSALHFPILLRIVGLGVSPLLALVLARHVLFRLLPASAANAAQVVLAFVLSVSVMFVVQSAQSALTACTAWLLANPRRDVRAREAFAALRGKLGAFAGAALLIEAAWLALLGVTSLAVGALFGQPLSLEVWRVLFNMSPGLTLVMNIVLSAMAGPATVRWCLAPSVLALERRGAMAALRRSSELVRRAQRPILLTWLAVMLVLQLPAVVTMIIVGSIVHTPNVSFEGMIAGDLTATIGIVAFCAAEAVLLLPFGVALAFGYLEARQAGGETIEGIVRTPSAP
jgi:serine/threonine protein kinase